MSILAAAHPHAGTVLIILATGFGVLALGISLAFIAAYRPARRSAPLPPERLCAIMQKLGYAPIGVSSARSMGRRVGYRWARIQPRRRRQAR